MCFLTVVMLCGVILFFFFFNDTATTEIYTLSLHDALPICCDCLGRVFCGGETLTAELQGRFFERMSTAELVNLYGDRKSTRLNSSHLVISYAVFCLKKKN